MKVFPSKDAWTDVKRHLRASLFLLPFVPLCIIVKAVTLNQEACVNLTAVTHALVLPEESSQLSGVLSGGGDLLFFVLMVSYLPVCFFPLLVGEAIRTKKVAEMASAWKQALRNPLAIFSRSATAAQKTVRAVCALILLVRVLAFAFFLMAPTELSQAVCEWSGESYASIIRLPLEYSVFCHLGDTLLLFLMAHALLSVRGIFSPR